MAIFFRELPDRRYRMSLRSKGEVNVSTVAEILAEADTNARAGARWMGRWRLRLTYLFYWLNVEPVILNANASSN